MQKYEIKGIVGEGAYGIVYQAKVKETGEIGKWSNQQVMSLNGAIWNQTLEKRGCELRIACQNAVDSYLPVFNRYVAEFQTVVNFPYMQLP